jgi:DNA repair exonuclease SbcCD ATPase subunit
MEMDDRVPQLEAGDRSSAIRFLPTMGVVVAAFSFMLTTVVWRLVHQTSAVEAAVHESIVGINRFSAANSEELSRLHEDLARQNAAVVALEARLGRVESTGIVSLERMQSLGADMARQWAAADHVRHALERSTTAISQTRLEVMERLAVHADRNAAARDAMIRQVNAAITQMEQSLLAQATDFQQQKQQFDAAAERDRATRRAMLNEATQAFAVQVEGLRQILDGLRVEAGEVGNAMTTETTKAAVGGSGDNAKPDKPGEPATAVRDREAVLE